MSTSTGYSNDTKSFPRSSPFADQSLESGSAPAHDKPQGWQRAKLEISRRGYQCFYECGAVFSNQKDAYHEGCPLRKQCDIYIQKQDDFHGQNGSPKYLPLRTWDLDDVHKFNEGLRQLPENGKKDIFNRFFQEK